jgi:hypothetical protein
LLAFFFRYFCHLVLYTTAELGYLHNKLLKLPISPNGAGPNTETDARPGPIDPID